jgi:hypothetical protein
MPFRSLFGPAPASLFTDQPINNAKGQNGRGKREKLDARNFLEVTHSRQASTPSLVGGRFLLRNPLHDVDQYCVRYQSQTISIGSISDWRGVDRPLR